MVKPRVGIRFLFYLLTSLRQNRWKATTGQPEITQSEILNIRVAFPQDEGEQRAIAHQLDAVNQLILAKQAKITALQRLKKSLMQNLLTGRMRLFVEAHRRTDGGPSRRKEWRRVTAPPLHDWATCPCRRARGH